MTIDQLKAMTQPERFAAFVAWLSLQPPNTPYEFSNSDNCAICQFVKKTTKISNVSSGGGDFNEDYETRFQVVDADYMACPTMDHPFHALVRCNTLGSLHDAIAKYITVPPETIPLTDAEMDALETRALIGVEVKS